VLFQYIYSEGLSVPGNMIFNIITNEWDYE